MKKAYAHTLSTLFPVLAALLLLAGCNTAKEAPEADAAQISQISQTLPITEIAETSQEAGYIALSQYEKIEKGMSYEEVRETAGTEGSVRTQSGEEGSDSYLIIYYWEGNRSDSEAVVVLQGDQVISKSQVGLD